MRKVLATISLLLLILVCGTSALAQDTPGTVKFPAAIDTGDSLVRASNRAQSSLNGAINSSVTTLTVGSTSTFPASGAVAIDSEVIFYTGKTSTTLTGLVRGADGTVAASHSSGASVRGVIVAAHTNTLGQAVILTQQKVGSGSGTPTAGKYLRGTGAGTSAWQNITTEDITIGIGFTPENPANKNQPNGYAGLDESGKLSSSVLPSYVSDDLVVNSVTATGDIHAARIFGNGAGITGLTGATGGVANTGSTTIGADIDSNGDGQIDFQIGLDTVGRFTTTGLFSLRGRGGVLYVLNETEYDVAEFTSLAQAITTLTNAISAGQRPTLKITKNVSVSNETIPEGVTTQVLGGSFTGTDGETFTIQGPFLAGGCARSQIFFNFLPGHGTVSFSGNKDVSRVCPDWWGAKADNETTDDRDAIQAAGSAANSAGGGVVVKFGRVAPNYYKYDTPLNFDGFVQVFFEGEGEGDIGAGVVGGAVSAPTKTSRSEVRYTGAATMGGVTGAADGISCDDCDGVQFRSLALTYSNPAFVGDLISFDGAGVAGQNWIIDSFLGGTGGLDATLANNAFNARSLVFFRNTVEGGIRDSALQVAEYGVIGIGRKADNSVGTGGNFSNGVQILSTRFQFFKQYPHANPGDNWKIKDNVYEFNPTGTTNALAGGNRQCRVLTTEPYAETTPREPNALIFSDNGVYDCFGGGGPYFEIRGKGVSIVRNKLNVATGSVVFKIVGSVNSGFYITQNTFTGGGTVVHFDPASTCPNNSIIEANGNLTTRPCTGYATRTAKNFQFSTFPASSSTVAMDEDNGIYYFDATAANITARLDEVDSFGNIKDRTQGACLTATAGGHTVTLKGKTDAVTINGVLGSTAGYVLSQVGQCVMFLNTNGTNWVTFSDGNKPASGVNLSSGNTGVLPPANGGTGASGVPTNGQIPIGNGTNYTPATITAGSGTAVTNGSGSVTISENVRTGNAAVIRLPNNVPFRNGADSTDNMADSTDGCKFIRFRPDHTTSVSKVSFRVGTAGATGAVGLYDSAGTTRLAKVDSISLAAGAANNTQNLSATATVDSGLDYVFAWSSSTTTATLLSTAALTAGQTAYWNVSVIEFGTCTALSSSGVMPASLSGMTAITSSDAVPFFTLHN